MSKKDISIDALNQLFKEAADENRKEYYEEVWQQLCKEVREEEEKRMIEQHEDMEFGRLDMEGKNENG